MDKHAALLELRQARSALVRWRHYIQGLTTGHTVGAWTVPVEPHQCILGQWLHGKGKDALGHIPQFQAIHESHAVLHRLHGQLHQHLLEEEAEHAYQKWQHLSQAFREVMDSLTVVEHELIGASHGQECQTA
jgi:hypothetical protein